MVGAGKVAGDPTEERPPALIGKSCGYYSASCYGSLLIPLKWIPTYLFSSFHLTYILYIKFINLSKNEWYSPIELNYVYALIRRALKTVEDREHNGILDASFIPSSIRRLLPPFTWYTIRDSNPEHLDPKSSVSANWTNGAYNGVTN